EVRTFEVVLDTDPGGRRVRHAHEDSEGLQTIAAVAIKREIAVVGGESASHPAADEDTGALPVRRCDIEARVGDRLPRSDQRQLTDAIQHPQPRRCKVLFPLESGTG